MRRPRNLAPVRIGDHDATDEERARLWDALVHSQIKSVRRLTRGDIDADEQCREIERQCSLGILLGALAARDRTAPADRPDRDRCRTRRTRPERDQAAADATPANSAAEVTS